MTVEQQINKRLAAFGLTVGDLTKEELREAKRDIRGDHTGGFFGSAKLISKSLMKGR